MCFSRIWTTNFTWQLSESLFLRRLFSQNTSVVTSELKNQDEQQYDGICHIYLILYLFILGFGKTLGCVSLENIFVCISAIFSSHPVFSSFFPSKCQIHIFLLQISFDWQLLLLQCYCCYFLHTISQLAQFLCRRPRNFSLSVRCNNQFFFGFSSALICVELL